MADRSETRRNDQPLMDLPKMPPLASADPTRSDHEVVELQLLLPRWQAAALEAAAQSRGMTTGQILRRVITDLFSERSAVAN
jgi:hypothetical protein